MHGSEMVSLGVRRSTTYNDEEDRLSERLDSFDYEEHDATL